MSRDVFDPLARTSWGVALLVSLASLSPCRAGEWVALPGAPTAARLDAVEFVDDQTGWVAGSTGRVHRTTDGGTTWVEQLAILGYFRALYFASPSIGFVGSLSGTLFRTTDGGDNWTDISANVPAPSPTGYCGISGSGNTVIATGKWVTPARATRSTDLGVTWSSVDLSTLARNLIDCHMVNETDGFAVGGSPGTAATTLSRILRTTDAGATWAVHYTGTIPGEYGWKIFFASPLVAYVSVYRPAGATVLRSTDAGATWTEDTLAGVNALQGIGFATDTIGWTIGESPDPCAAFTDDGGDTWSVGTFAGVGKPYVNRFEMLSPTLGYASGVTVYKYTETPTSVIATPQRKRPLNLRNHPNPFRVGTSIAFDLPREAQVTVRIYDFLGRELRTIFEGSRPAGQNSVSWDGRDGEGNRMAAGVYLYRVDAGSEAESAIMTFLR